MSNFELLYKSNYDYKNNGFGPSTTNYFEKEIKEGLPYFQQNKLQSTLRNNFFNENNNNTNPNNIKLSSREKNDMINLEAKKIIEREMSPYINLMKQELNLIVENYRKDFREKNENIQELEEIKNEFEKIKQSNEDIKNYLEQKIIKSNDIMNEQDQKMNNMQLDINKFNQLFQIQLEHNTTLPNLSNDIYKLKQDLNLQQTTLQKLLSEQKNNTEQAINLKFNECENKINNIKGENELLKKSIDELNNALRLVQIKSQEKNEDQLNQSNLNNDLKNLVQQIQLDLNTKENAIKNLEDMFNINKNKLEQLNQKIENAFININTEHNSIIVIAQELKNIKSDIEKSENYLENNSYKKEFLDQKFEIINEQMENINAKMKEQYLKFNENINEKNNKLILDVNKKLEQNKINFQNSYDEIDGQIVSINDKISELTTNIQTHPMFNMNNNEIINLKFKENQMIFNTTFKKSLEAMKQEIDKINKNIIINQKENDIKNNLAIKQDLDNINAEINNMKQFPEFINKVKQDLNIRINLLQQQIPKENIDNDNEKINLEPINILKKEINRISKDVKNLKEEKIPEILILIENLKNAENNSNNNSNVNNNLMKKNMNENIDKNNEQNNEEINIGSRRKKETQMSQTWSRRNNGKSIFDSINNINNNININMQQKKEENNFNNINDLNNNNNFEDMNTSNNLINDVKKFMQNNKNKMNIKEELNESENMNGMNNDNEFNNNDINNFNNNRQGNEEEYNDFNSDFNENNNKSNNNQSNFYGLNSSNNNNSKEKDEADKYVDEILNNKNNENNNLNNTNNSRQNSKNKESNDFDENFDDDEFEI